MKRYLSLTFLLAVLHLSQAGPLRIQKRAAFYIANETACVVDNIVYSSGDPIPTDDPCEACKCRPPGFACVLKECKAKPGCRAVRHAGQCCPEYICGCEHNGRMYSDGEEIRDEKNPCYECHCQGSSIACAFVDCFFRVDCVPVYVPGKCCPTYRNCARDEPERTSVIGDNALPPVNLLPGLYDESVLTGNSPSTQVPETLKEITNQSQPSTEGENVSVAEVNEPPKDLSNKFLSSELEVPIIEKDKSSNSETEEKETEEQNEEVKSSNSEIGEKNTEEQDDSEIEVKDTEEHNKEKVPSEEETDGSQNEESTTKKETIEETKVLLNSETEIKVENNEDIKTEEKITEEHKPVTEDKVSTKAEPEIQVNSQTTVKATEIVKDEAATEKFLEVVTSTVKPVTEKFVKNSAAENGKSLKLTENEKSETETLITTEEKPSEVKSDDTKLADTTENEPEKIAVEESISNPQSIALDVEDDKLIKKESAETVTIVVHVREKAKPTADTDVAEEQTTTEESTSKQTSEILLKSNDLKNEYIIEPIVETTQSTNTNFEVFPSSTEIIKESSASSVEQPEQNITEKSETDSIKSDIKETIKSTLKPDFDASQNVNEHLSEVNKEKEARTDDEIAEETKDEIKVAKTVSEEFNPETEKEEIKVTEQTYDLKTTEEIKVPNTEQQPNLALKIEIVPNSKEQTSKTEETSTEPQEKIAEENKLNEEIEDSNEKPKLKSQDILTKNDEKEQIKESKPEEKAKESKSENDDEEVQPTVKVEESKSESEDEKVIQPTEKVESKSEGKVEEVQPIEKVEESKSEEKEKKSKSESGDEEVQPTVKVEESKSESVDIKVIHPIEKGESKSKDEVEAVQPIEKVEESKSEETIAETSKPEEKKEHAYTEEKN